MSLQKEDVQAVLDIVNLALKYGVPLVKDVVSAWESDKEVTVEMIEELMASVKPASELLEGVDELED